MSDRVDKRGILQSELVEQMVDLQLAHGIPLNPPELFQFNPGTHVEACQHIKVGPETCFVWSFLPARSPQ